MEIAILCEKASEGQPAVISRSISRAGQTTLNTTTPSGPSYDGGIHFCHCARQGSKKLVRKKIVSGVCVWGAKICQRTTIIPSSELLKTKNDENDNVVVAVAATVKKVWWQNF
jgi:hypothetical protein